MNKLILFFHYFSSSLTIDNAYSKFSVAFPYFLKSNSDNAFSIIFLAYNLFSAIYIKFNLTYVEILVACFGVSKIFY